MIAEKNSLREWFGDEESREIFDFQYDFGRTGDCHYVLRRVAKMHNSWQNKLIEINKCINQSIACSNKDVYIFGAGVWGGEFFEATKQHGVYKYIKGFCDNDKKKHNTLFCGKPVTMLSYIDGKKDSIYLIPDAGGGSYEQYKQLKELGVCEENIILLPRTYIDLVTSTERDDLEDILLDGKNHFILYLRGDGTRCGRLFKECGLHVDFSIGDSMDVDNSFDFLKHLDNYYVIVNRHKEKLLLLEQGIPERRIIHLVNTNGFLQYFDGTISHENGKDEVFIDAGALDMASSQRFLIWCRNECKRIVAFEASRKNAVNCYNKLMASNGLGSISTLVNKATWNKDTKLMFEMHTNNDQLGSSHILLNDKEKDSSKKDIEIHMVEATSIDNVMQGDKVTFIKMDIEGAELESLKGAEKTIRKWSPVLAISVYHKREDIIDIPTFIKSINPSYKLFLRCYHEAEIETIMYAIP